MARIGIAYEVVAAAADALLAEGRKTTLAAVRERIGSGSMNTIHRHSTIWQGRQKPVPRKLSEPNTRLLSALEAERDALAEQLLQITTERDTLAGKSAGQSAEIERLLTQDAERERDDAAVVRRMLAQAELRLEAVPRLEEELVQLRAQLAAEQTARTEADKMAAVAEARRAAAEAAQAQAEARLASAEQREGRVRVELAEAQAAHQSTRERLTEAVGVAAGAQAELKAWREKQAEAAKLAETQGHTELDAHGAGSAAQRPARSRKPPAAAS